MEYTQGNLKLDLEVWNKVCPDILHLLDLNIFEIDVARKGEEHVLKWTCPRKLQLFSSKSSVGQMKILHPGDLWKRQIGVYTLWGVRKNTVSVDFSNKTKTSYHLYFISKHLTFNQHWVLSSFNEYETSMFLHACEANIVTTTF